jgi:type I restriction enzyme M protein
MGLIVEYAYKEKDDKIWSPIFKKWIIKTPEEWVKQKYLETILNHYGFYLEQIAENVVTIHESQKFHADFVIWRTSEEKERQDQPLIVIGCSSGNVSIKKEDFLNEIRYAQLTHARFFVSHNNHETKYWGINYSKSSDYVEEIEDIPHADFSEIQIEDLLSKLKVFKNNEFADLLHQCHNIIRNREKLDPAAAFDEIAKILFMKVYTERTLKQDLKSNIFTLNHIENAEHENSDYISFIFEKTKTDFGKDKIFSKDEKINLRANTIKAIIEKLEKYNLSALSSDVKGIAFEKFLGKTFRGEIGQFFTPRPIVEFMVNMVDPKEGDIICDPASGSGGFLIRFFEMMREEISKKADDDFKEFRQNLEDRTDIDEKAKIKKINKEYEKLQNSLISTKENSRIWNLSNRCIFGTDANERMSRTSKMNMIMHGDGHGGIHHHDGFLNVNGIFEDRFDIVLTNPPFGQNVEKDDIVLQSQIEIDDETKAYYQKIYGDAFDKSQEKIIKNLGKPITSLYDLPKGHSIKTEILFLERCLSLLKPGGRLGIVLPEGILNNPSLAYVREFAEDRAHLSAVISLPQETFSSTGANVKASLIFLTKFTEQENKQWKECIEQSKKDLTIHQKEERDSLNAIIKSIKSLKIDKEAAKKKIKLLDKIVETNGRHNAKQNFNYFIFMYQAEHVGITSTGEEDENELPKIAEQYKKFRQNPELFLKFLERNNE